MLINRNDRVIGRSISVHGNWEGQYIQLLKKIITKFYPKDSSIEVIDGGANLGVYAISLAKIDGFKVKVLAIEAQRLIFQMLNANVALNSLENIWTYHKVIGNKDGQIFPIECPDMNLPANFGAFEIQKASRNTDYDGKKFMSVEHVESIKLDSLPLENCALIKLDVEGMEDVAFEGAEELIRRMKPILFFERHKTDYEKVKKTLARHDYCIWELPDQNTLALRKEWNVTIPNFSKIQLSSKN